MPPSERITAITVAMKVLPVCAYIIHSPPKQFVYVADYSLDSYSLPQSGCRSKSNVSGGSNPGFNIHIEQPACVCLSRLMHGVPKRVASDRELSRAGVVAEAFLDAEAFTGSRAALLAAPDCYKKSVGQESGAAVLHASDLSPSVLETRPVHPDREPAC